MADFYLILAGDCIKYFRKGFPRSGSPSHLLV